MFRSVRTLICVSIVTFLLGVFLLLPFPLWVFPALLNSRIPLEQGPDGSMEMTTLYWARLPATQYFAIYLFNITNKYEVLMAGAVPEVRERGPYVYAEREFKQEIDWREGGSLVSFKTNKTWVWNKERSCETCEEQDQFDMPNLSMMTLAYHIRKQRASRVASRAVDILLYILAEVPIRRVSMREVMFGGVNDPLIRLQNSPFNQLLMNMTGGKLLDLQLPDTKAVGVFPLYNHTTDEEYIVHTGQDDYSLSHSLHSWAGESRLPWWKGEAADIRGHYDGSFHPPHVDKAERMSVFQSFACRSFHLHYTGDGEINGMPTYIFESDEDDFDTDADENSGYVYGNPERIDYFPGWPCGDTHVYRPDAPECPVDCSKRGNYCSRCCNGTLHEGTYRLPTGIVRQACMPGRLHDLPLAGFLSPPHLLHSPPEVIARVPGVCPDPRLHHPIRLEIHPLIGSTMAIHFRTQFNVPIYQMPELTMLSNVRTSFIPFFWSDVTEVTDDYAIHAIRLLTLTVPKIVMGIGIALVAGSVLVWCAVGWSRFSRSRKTRRERSLPSERGGRAQQQYAVA